MSKKPIPPKYLTSFQPFHCTKEFWDAVAIYFYLNSEDDEEKKKLIRLGEQIKVVIDSHLLYKYRSQTKKKEIQNYLEKKEGKKLINQAKELFKTLEAVPEAVFNHLSLKILKEELEFLIDPNSGLYSREDCESGFISRYEIAYLNQLCAGQEKHLAEAEDKKEAFRKMMEVLICDEDEVSVRIPFRLGKGRKSSETEERTEELAERPLLGKKKEQRRISRMLRDIFKGFYFPSPLNNELQARQKNFVNCVLEEIDLHPKEKEI